MRHALAFCGAVLFLGSAAPAHAYCCVFNPAICQAVCGAACCGAALTNATPVSPDRLGNFQVQQLMSEYNQAELTEPNGAFLRLLKPTVDARRATVPAVQ
jgi:hypothetical protein